MKILMYLPALATFTAGILLATEPSPAQTYAPGYPVCMQVWGRFSYIDCRYTSIPQCRASASGRSATCLDNPNYAAAVRGQGPRLRHHPYTY